jgi:hypothetical protein
MPHGAKFGGRTKGTPNKISAIVREAIVEAATEEGNGSLVTYLRRQARENPASFLRLLGKLLPSQITDLEEDDTQPVVYTRIERIIVDPVNNITYAGDNLDVIETDKHY